MKKLKIFALIYIICSICFNCSTTYSSKGTQDTVVFPQLGHSHHITSVEFSPDGKLALSGSFDMTIKLWDVDSGREIRTFEGHTRSVSDVSFSPDGKQALSGSRDENVKLWDITSGREIKTFVGYTRGVFSPDGKLILLCPRDGNFKLLNLKNYREIRTFQGSGDFFSFSPDGSKVISGSNEHKNIKLWDVSSGKEIITFAAGAENLGCLSFSPDGRWVISGAGTGNIRLWNAATGRIIRTFTRTTDVLSVRFSPDGKFAVSGHGGSDYYIRLWDVATGQEIRRFIGHGDGVKSVSFSPDGKFVLSGSGYMSDFGTAFDNTIRLWNAATGQEIRTFADKRYSVNSVSLSPDGKLIISGGSRDNVKVWDLTTVQQSKSFPDYKDDKRPNVSSVSFSPDGKQALIGSNTGVKLWDLTTGQEIRTFAGKKAIFNPDGNQVLSVLSGGIIKLWDKNSGNEIQTFEEIGEVNSVNFSADGKWFISGADVGYIQLWEIATGRGIRNIRDRGLGGVKFASFSPDGKLVISGSNEIKLWDIISGSEIRTFSSPKVPIKAVIFSADGKQALSGSDIYKNGRNGDSVDYTLKLWDIDSGSVTRTFSGHRNAVNSVSFSPDGKQALSGSSDGTIKLWDTSTGNEIAQFISYNDGEWLIITPDGFYNVSENGEKYINVRVKNNIYGIAQYRNYYHRPDIIAARLSGIPDPVR